jgi:hypothetical protein
MRVGYACICLGEEGLRCQRTTVLRNATPERLRGLIEQNLDGLAQILSQDPEKRPGAHAYGIDPAELESFLQRSAAVPRDFDIMFEAKGKDRAVEAALPLLRADLRFAGQSGCSPIG